MPSLFPRRTALKFTATLSLACATVAPAAAQPQCIAPTVMIVLDKSGSMKDEGRWDAAKAAIQSVTAAYKGDIRFGIMLFPGSSVEGCLEGKVWVDPELHTEVAINDAMSKNKPGGQTPIALTLATLKNYAPLQDKTRPNFVMFVTDGTETCTEPLEDSPVTATAELKALGITTFVVGFGADASIGADTLTRMATAGGTARATTPAYYQANDAIALDEALGDIARRVSDETCDGFDNDCDGTADNIPDTPCTGACGVGGIQICESGVISGCTAPAEDEIGKPCTHHAPDGTCMGGAKACTGNGLECVPTGEPTQEICDGEDNDCDGEIDEDYPLLGQPCDTGLKGVCAEGTLACDGGGSACKPKYEPGTQPEICDGFDNDCDGDTDEEVKNACGTCGEPPAETCDGQDNDCDGVIDNGLINVCGVCGTEAIEICDGKDNDCDGDIDETGACPSGLECRFGECLAECVAGECPAGSECQVVEGRKVCVSPDFGACQGTTCGEGQVCTGGSCHDPCDGVTCGEGQACVLGACRGLCATDGDCGGVLVCQGGQCRVPEGVTLCQADGDCPETEFCEGGRCVPGIAEGTEGAEGGEDFDGGVPSDGGPDGGVADGGSTEGVEGIEGIEGEIEEGGEGTGDEETVVEGNEGAAPEMPPAEGQEGSAPAIEPAPGGCGCAAQGPSAGLAWLAVGLIGFVRRRGRATA